MSLVGSVEQVLKSFFFKEFYKDTSEINITTTDADQDHKNELGVQLGKTRGTFIFNYGGNPATITRPNGATWNIPPGVGLPFPFEGFDQFKVKSTNSGEHTTLYIVSWL